MYASGASSPPNVALMTSTLTAVCKSLKQRDVVRLRIVDSDTVHLVVSREEAIGKRTSTFKLRQITLQSTPVIIPNREYPCQALLSKSALISACQELDEAGGDTTLLSMKENEITFYSKNTTVETNINLKLATMHRQGRVLCNQPTSESFKTSHFTRIMKLAKLRQATELLVKVHEHWPLSVGVNLGDLGEMSMHVAPHIEPSDVHADELVPVESDDSNE